MYFEQIMHLGQLTSLTCEIIRDEGAKKNGKKITWDIMNWGTDKGWRDPNDDEEGIKEQNSRVAAPKIQESGQKKKTCGEMKLEAFPEKDEVT